MNKEKTYLLTVKEAAKLLHVHIRTVQRLSKKGKIKAVKIGNQWRYKRSDVERYAEFGIDISKEAERKQLIEKKNIERSDRRSYQRINSNISCDYSVNLHPFKSIKNKGILRNLSGGGVLFRAFCDDIKKIYIDDPIKISFKYYYLDKQEYVETIGRVVRRNDNDIGVKFRNIKESVREKIIEYIG